MLAFHNNPALKEKYQQRLAAHHAADDIIRGTYHAGDGKSGWRGCAVGCTLHSRYHGDAEKEIGVPAALMHLDDQIFESLRERDAPQWAVDFLAAIPVGADLSLVASRFMLWVLSDPEFGSRQYCSDKGKAVTDAVIALYNRRLAGEEPTKDEWQAYATYAPAAYAADAAPVAAAYAADAAPVADVAYAAAYAADVAYAAAYAAARKTEFWEAAKTRLLELLASAPLLAL